MSTFADLLTDVKQSCRETTTEKDGFLLAAAGRIYRNYLRMDNWPQARVTGQTISVVSGTQFYDLPADFDRFTTNIVNYLWSGAINTMQWPVPVLTRGSAMDDRRITLWEGVLTTGFHCPSVVAIGGGGANTYQLGLYPLAGSTGDTITFDYYSAPDRSSFSTATTVIDPLYETMVAALSAEYMRFVKAADEYQMFKGEQVAAHRLARQTLARL